MKILRGKHQPEESPLVNQVRDLFKGFRCVLVLSDRVKTKCSCYNDLEHTYDSKHEVCLGTGWIQRMEKHHAWFQVAGVPQSLPRVMDTLEAATIAVNAKFFYFFRSAILNEGDDIVILEFDEQGLPVYGTMDFYIVNHPEAKYDEHGKLIYWKVGCERNLIDADKRSIAIYNQRYSIRNIELT